MVMEKINVAELLKDCPRSMELDCTMYNDIAPSQEPTQEWYRPTLKEALKWRSKNTMMLEHILQGGLDVRNIK
jgi:hypothetical protein